MLLPKSAGFVCTQVSEKWCSFTYGFSGASFKSFIAAFRSSRDVVVAETRSSNRKVSESRIPNPKRL